MQKKVLVLGDDGVGKSALIDYLFRGRHKEGHGIKDIVICTPVILSKNSDKVISFFEFPNHPDLANKLMHYVEQADMVIICVEADKNKTVMERAFNRWQDKIAGNVKKDVSVLKLITKVDTADIMQHLDESITANGSYSLISVQDRKKMQLLFDEIKTGVGFVEKNVFLDKWQRLQGTKIEKIKSLLQGYSSQPWFFQGRRHHIKEVNEILSQLDSTSSAEDILTQLQDIKLTNKKGKLADIIAVIEAGLAQTPMFDEMIPAYIM